MENLTHILDLQKKKLQEEQSLQKEPSSEAISP